MSSTDFLSSLTNALLPFDIAGAGSDTPAASGNPVSNPTGTTPSTASNNATSSFFSGLAAWFQGVIIQLAAIFLGLILVAIALIMMAQNRPLLGVEGKVTQ